MYGLPGRNGASVVQPLLGLGLSMEVEGTRQRINRSPFLLKVWPRLGELVKQPDRGGDQKHQNQQGRHIPV